MGAKIALKSSMSITKHTRLDRCYLVSDEGQEVKVTQSMIRMACAELLSRCKK